MSKSKDATKHSNILNAATKVFGKKGFTQAKISEIAREAGVADGTIYLYFRNKDHLLVATFEHNLDLLMTQIQQAMNAVQEPLEKLRIFIEKHLELIGQNRELARVFQVELHHTHPYLHEASNRKIEEYLQIIDQLIENGQNQGLLRNDLHAETVNRVLFGALSDVAIYTALNSEQGLSLKDRADQVYQIFTGGLLMNATAKTHRDKPLSTPQTTSSLSAA